MTIATIGTLRANIHVHMQVQVNKIKNTGQFFQKLNMT